MASVSRIMAPASPNGAANPISFSLSSPFSKHSIAQATVAPVPMVSSPWSLQILFASETASSSFTPQYEPKVAMVSYSGPPNRFSIGRPAHSASTTRLQRTVQA